MASIALLAGGLYYDQLCSARASTAKRWSRRRSSRSRLVAGASHVYSGRAVYADRRDDRTMMAANVAHVIIPSQRALVERRSRASRPTWRTGCGAAQRAQQLLHAAESVRHDQQPLPDDLGAPHLVVLVAIAAPSSATSSTGTRGGAVWAIPVAAALGALVLAVAIARGGPRPSPAFAESGDVSGLRGLPRRTPVQDRLSRRKRVAAHPRTPSLRRRRSTSRRRRRCRSATHRHDRPERAKLGAWFAAGALAH
jgi:hypothetical protein